MIFDKERTQERKRQLELETAVEKAVKLVERKGQLGIEAAVEKAVKNAERKCINDFIASLIKENVMTLERIATIVGVPISEVRGINSSIAINTGGTQAV